MHGEARRRRPPPASPPLVHTPSTRGGRTGGIGHRGGLREGVEEAAEHLRARRLVVAQDVHLIRARVSSAPEMGGGQRPGHDGYLNTGCAPAAARGGRAAARRRDGARAASRAPRRTHKRCGLSQPTRARGGAERQEHKNAAPAVVRAAGRLHIQCSGVRPCRSARPSASGCASAMRRSARTSCEAAPHSQCSACCPSAGGKPRSRAGVSERVAWGRACFRAC